MKNRKEFDNILEECLERILTRGETIEQCLASYPEQAPELEPLLQTALSTKETLAIKPRPEFKDRARHQLRLALQETEVKRERRFSLFSWQPRWATAVIAVLILLLAGGSTVAAAGNSMPDQPLYPVKLATERVQLAFTPSALGKAELHARLVDKRVTEIVNMAHKGKLEQMERTTHRLNTQLMTMTSLVGPPAEEAGALLAPAPPAVTDEPPQKEAVVRVTPARPMPGRAPAIRPVPEGAPVRPEAGGESIRLDRRAKLREMVARNAMKHPAALRAALEKVPEPARRRLLQAIAASDAEYEKVLEALRERAGD
ncbi:DUF5667 domain-containing protein [Chloroflexota bacterium]